MVCYNAYSQPEMDNTQNACASNNGFCGGGNSFACIINLIIILVVLQFLTQILCNTTCDMC